MKAPHAEGERFFPLLMPSSSVKHPITLAINFVIYARAFESSAFRLLPPTAPGLFFKVRRAEDSLSFAFGPPLAVMLFS